MRQQRIAKWIWVLVLLCVEIAITYAEDAKVEDDSLAETWKWIARGKKKKSKFILPLLMGMVLVKSFIIPLALKAMAIVSGKAIMLSALSLILASIVGFKKVATNWDRSGPAPLKDRGDGTYFTPVMDTQQYGAWSERTG